MNSNLVICGYNLSTKTLIIVCIIVVVLFLLFKGTEKFTEPKKNCSDIAPGNCTSELCSELSFCRPQKTQNSNKCNCTERKNDD